MSLAVTHFAFGAAMTTIVVWAVAPSHRYRTTLAVLGGLWALVPDLHYVVPGRVGGTTRGLKQTVLGDVFWFHATMDGLVQGEGTRLGAAIALGFLLIVVAASELLAGSTGLRGAEDQPEDSVGS